MPEVDAPARDVRVCSRDGEPLVFTFEFPGAEFVCICGNTEGVLGKRVPSSPALTARLDELTEVYERDRAERRGVEYVPVPKAGADGVEAPTCGGCGVKPADGTALPGGKPLAWFSKTVDGVTSHACSRACIPEREGILPW